MSDRFKVRMTDTATEMLRSIGKRFGRHTYEVIKNLLRDLEFDPDQKGDPLRGLLKGLYSLHYSRFRIIYKVRKEQVQVIVVGAGHHQSGSRKDIYKIIERLVDSGALNLEDVGGH